MSVSKTVNNRIDKIHEKALRFVYENKTKLSFDDMLKNDKSVSIHQRNPQILATKIKARNDLESEIMKDKFHYVQKLYSHRND